MTKVRLLGNHSAVHSGSAAVWKVLRTFLSSKTAELVDTDDYDVLVVNGEGSMHHGRPTFHTKMRALGDALSRGRKAYLVNSVWQENPNSYDSILRSLNGIVVRETMSKSDLAERHGVAANVSIDLSYFASVDVAGSCKNFDDRIVISDFFSADFGNFVRPTAGALADHAYLNLSDGDWDFVVRSLKTSRLFVTGRHHGVYAACRARVPFIALQGNSHKVSGLFRSAKVRMTVCESVPELIERVKTWKSDLTEFKRLWDWLDTRKIEEALPSL